MAKTKKRIVVLGGGFAGVECTRKLESYFKNESEIEIVLVNEDNFLLFTPLLPQVASGMIETRHAITSIRTITKKYESLIVYASATNRWPWHKSRGYYLQ